MFRLDNPVRPYAWGSKTAMAELFGHPASDSPQAEMWMGAHPDSPSIAKREDGSSVRLNHLIETGPGRFLGPQIAENFEGRLPFLAKVLAADAPLSLQVHPTKEQARQGYAAEEEAGILRSDSQRMYRDTNHKPEMIVALTNFEALCGLRSPAAASQLFLELRHFFIDAATAVPRAIDVVLERLGHDEGLQSALDFLLRGGKTVSEAVAASATHLEGSVNLRIEFTWLLKLARAYPEDPGVLISLLLNYVALTPGEALCLPAGNVHAYLRGVGFEVMASSDNVLRGGLTSKHVDIPEFIRSVDFRPLPVPTVTGLTHPNGITRWVPPFQEFQVERLTAEPGNPEVPLNRRGPLLVLVVHGEGNLATPEHAITLHAGESAFVPANEGPVTLAASQGLLAFAVTVGEQTK
ncbi:mannose-6-phosphate isomerase, class I [Paenarthrobacter nicotinovorans]|uniref:mannose-6-phosphate isomerase, class I n=1 Tax=Paenarthrobacter nicotinovorans TaxID=29320 RepID=UPI003749BE50